ncbi:MAG: acyl carrier protein [Oscillospiraceae bacterium]|nr:acyl carrier protein [Oscillospiraceae bacterium]
MFFEKLRGRLAELFGVSKSEITPEMAEQYEKLKGILAEQFSVSESDITLETALEDDLGADSVDVVELSMTLEEQFEAPELTEEEILQIHTVGDLLKILQKGNTGKQPE